MTLAAETLQPVHEMNLDELQLEIDLALAMNTVPMNLSLGYRQSASVDNLRTVVAECRQFAELRREDPHATELPRTPPPKKPKTSPVWVRKRQSSQLSDEDLWEQYEKEVSDDYAAMVRAIGNWYS